MVSIRLGKKIGFHVIFGCSDYNQLPSRLNLDRLKNDTLAGSLITAKIMDEKLKSAALSDSWTRPPDVPLRAGFSLYVPSLIQHNTTFSSVLHGTQACMLMLKTPNCAE